METFYNNILIIQKKPVDSVSFCMVKEGKRKPEHGSRSLVVYYVGEASESELYRKLFNLLLDSWAASQSL